MKLDRRFLKEEKGQTSLEFVVMMGGIIISAFLIYGYYTRWSKTTSEPLNASIHNASELMGDRITNEIAT
jgi:uncharacterized protein (UPF0333 family)